MLGVNSKLWSNPPVVRGVMSQLPSQVTRSVCNMKRLAALKKFYKLTWVNAFPQNCGITGDLVSTEQDRQRIYLQLSPGFSI